MLDAVVERIISEARRAGLRPSSEDVADTLWLAVQMARVAGVSPAGDDSEERSATDSTDPDDVAQDGMKANPSGMEPAPSAGGLDGDDRLKRSPDARDDIALTTEEAVAGQMEVRRASATDETSGEGVPFRAPAAPELAARLRMARSMRPLKRRVAARAAGELNASATAHQAAETDLFLPVFAPRLERWLDAAVVVDDSSSMAVSTQTVAELVMVLTDLGGFRDVRVWRVNTDDVTKPLRLRANHNTAVWHDPMELVDPSGRRIVLVVSDCLGRAWRDGRMGVTLQRWSVAGPLAVVQPLPQRLWPDCAPGLRSVTVRVGAAGAANSTLQVRLDDEFFERDDMPAGQLGTVVPVIELGERWLASWSDLVAGGTGRWLSCKALFTGLMNSASDEALGEVPPTDPTEIVRRFEATASKSAFRLAALLAAAAPLDLPVMRLVQRATLPTAPPTALREVFLGTLLQRVADPAAPSVTDPDEVTYDFLPGVREELLGRLTRQDALNVLVEVSRYLAAHLGANRDFLAWISPDSPVQNLDQRTRAFATVTVDVLRSMGGSYRDKADRLQEQLEERHYGERSELAAAGQRSVIENEGARNPGRYGRTAMTDFSMQSSVYVPTRESGRVPAGWKTAPPKNPHFVGRDEMLDQLRSLLINRSQTAVLLPRALYGLGGVGKTQLATEYVHRFRDDYDLIWWIAAEDPAEIRRSLVELAAELQVTTTTDTAETIRRVQERLTERSPYEHWLLVFDNLGEPAVVASLVPQSRGGHVLITTRDRDWADQGRAVEVGKFDRSESIALLRERSSISETDANEIAERLADLPISLAQAAAWHTETGKPVSEYLRQFAVEEDRRQDEVETLGYPKHAAAAMSIAFEQLRSSSPAAAQLLQLASYFGPEWISLEMLHRGRLATPLSRRLGSTLRNQSPLQRCIKDIARLELARYDTRNDRFQIHRLVQKMVQSEMQPDERDEVRTTVQLMLAHANPGNPDLIVETERRKHAQLSAHIIASDVIESSEDEARQVVVDQIRYLYRVGDFESSRQLADKVVDRWKDRWPADDELTLIARRHLANAIRQLGSPAEALKMDEAVLVQFQRSYGPDNEHTMATVNSVAADLRAVGLFARARELDEDNYLRYQRVLGAEDFATLRAGANFAVDLRMVGAYAQALVLDEEVLAIRRRVYGPDEQETLLVAGNVTRDLYALGRYSESLRRQRDVLPAHERVLQPDHADVLGARRTIAISLRKLGRTAEALDEARSLRLAHRNKLGESNPQTLLITQSLVNALRDNGSVSESVRDGEEVYKQYQELYPDHPFTDVCAVNLAIAYRQAGRVNEARELNEMALGRLREAFRPDHPYALCCATNLANDLAASGRHDAALALSHETYQLSREVRKPDSPDLPANPYDLACMNNYAIDLITAGNEAEGHALQRQALDLMSRHPDLGEGHPDTKSVRDGRRLDCDIEPPPT